MRLSYRVRWGNSDQKRNFSSCFASLFSVLCDRELFFSVIDRVKCPLSIDERITEKAWVTKKYWPKYEKLCCRYPSYPIWDNSDQQAKSVRVIPIIQRKWPRAFSPTHNFSFINLLTKTNDVIRQPRLWSMGPENIRMVELTITEHLREVRNPWKTEKNGFGVISITHVNQSGKFRSLWLFIWGNSDQ